MVRVIKKLKRKHTGAIAFLFLFVEHRFHRRRNRRWGGVGEAGAGDSLGPRPIQ